MPMKFCNLKENFLLSISTIGIFSSFIKNTSCTNEICCRTFNGVDYDWDFIDSMNLITEINENCRNGGKRLSDLFMKYVVEFVPLECLNTGFVSENEKKIFNSLLLEQSNLVQALKLDMENFTDTMNNSREIIDLTELSKNIDSFLDITGEILRKWEKMLYKIYINSNNMCFEINEIINLLKIEDVCLSKAFNDIGSKYKALCSKKYIDLKFQYIHESTLMTRDIVYFKAVSEVLKEIMFHFKTLALTHKLQIILDFKDIRHESFSKFKQFIIILTSSCELFDSKSENSIQHHFEKLCNVDAFLYKELNRYTSLLLKFTFKYKKIKTVLKIMKSLN